MIREKEADVKFKKALQSPLNPINNTEPSQEMKDYLNDLNHGKKEKKEDDKKEDEYLPTCPHCRRYHAIKRTPQGLYCCGYCGLTSNSPLMMKK